MDEDDKPLFYYATFQTRDFDLVSIVNNRPFIPNTLGICGTSVQICSLKLENCQKEKYIYQ